MTGSRILECHPEPPAPAPEQVEPLPFGEWEDMPDPVWPVVPEDPFDLSYSRVKLPHEGIDDEF